MALLWPGRLEMDENWQSRAGVSAGSCPACEPDTALVELELHLMRREQNWLIPQHPPVCSCDCSCQNQQPGPHLKCSCAGVSVRSPHVCVCVPVLLFMGSGSCPTTLRTVSIKRRKLCWKAHFLWSYPVYSYRISIYGVTASQE